MKVHFKKAQLLGFKGAPSIKLAYTNAVDKQAIENSNFTYPGNIDDTRLPINIVGIMSSSARMLCISIWQLSAEGFYYCKSDIDINSNWEFSIHRLLTNGKQKGVELFLD
jgi:hypothetical protein